MTMDFPYYYFPHKFSNVHCDLVTYYDFSWILHRSMTQIARGKEFILRH